MGTPSKALTDMAVKSAAPGRYADKHPDGKGLYLLVRDTGSRSWLLRVMVDGKRRDYGLGGYPATSLAKARETAKAWREIAKSGRDPSIVAAQLKREQEARDNRANRTFRDAAEALIEMKAPGWKNDKHKAQWSYSLREFVYPRIGNEPVDKIDAEMIAQTLIPIWLRLPETARRVRQRIGSVLEYAHALKWRSAPAPMLAVQTILPKQPKDEGHFAAVPFEDAPAVMAKLRAEAGTIGRTALEFTILTAARSGEVRGARWNEIDLEARTWTVPASRMKAKKEHVVPLSDRAIELLLSVKALAGKPDTLIFPGLRDKPMSDMTMSKAQRALAPGTTVHGWRSTFRDWVSESTSFAGEVAEMALAHTISNKVEAAYRRGNLQHKRRELMDAWSSYLSNASDNIVDMEKARAAKESAA